MRNGIKYILLPSWYRYLQNGNFSSNSSGSSIHVLCIPTSKECGNCQVVGWKKILFIAWKSDLVTTQDKSSLPMAVVCCCFDNGECWYVLLSMVIQVAEVSELY